jgi:hypothetical protein
VTYSPGYLEQHREIAEDQMRREIAAPTPLHAADLQFQAFAEFDCSKALPNIRVKPIILVAQLGSNLPFILLSNWLRVLGYRPVTIGISVNFDDQSIANSIRDTTQRIGRKAVLIVPASGMPLTTRIAEAHKDWVSDIVVLNASQQSNIRHGVRTHFISSGWSWLFAMAALPQLLRNIRIELIEAPPVHRSL